MWSRIDFTNVLGMEAAGDEHEMDDSMTKADIVLRLAAALNSGGECADNAKKIIDKCVFITGNVNNALDSDDEEPDGHPAASDEQIVVYPLTKTDAFLAKVLKVQSGKFVKRFSSENLPLPNSWQRRYLRHCNELVVPEMQDGEQQGRPAVNRSVLRKLGEITPRTHRLDFSAHMLGPVGVIPLCLALRNMKTLQAINLSWNDVRDMSLQYIEELIESCPKLAYIDLGQNKYLAATAGRVLVQMVKRFPGQLRYVKTNGCNIPAYYTRAIKNLLPDLGPLESASEGSVTPPASGVYDRGSADEVEDVSMPGDVGDASPGSEAAPPHDVIYGALDEDTGAMTLANTDLGVYLDLDPAAASAAGDDGCSLDAPANEAVAAATSGDPLPGAD